MNSKDILSQIISFLSARKKIGGLEISDTNLRFAYYKNGSLATLALRLPPGVLDDGDIKDYQVFVETLRRLHEMIPEDFGGKNPASVVVTLSSVHVYTQVFTLPIVEDENLKEAIQLNISMISPFELSQAYAGWQLISKDGNNLNIEVLSAFARKDFIDKLRKALNESGFFPFAVESASLSLARLVRENGTDFRMERPLLVISVDDIGIKFLIIRFGQLHFEYSQLWKDIQWESKNISWENFEEALKRNLRQVINFYGSHWQEPLIDAFIASNSLVGEISKTVKENFSLNVGELRLKSEQSLGREWYEAAGAVIRGEMPRTEDKDINLFGITVQEEFRQQQIIDFMKFWQVLIASSLATLLAFMSVSYVFLANMGKSVESQLAFNISEQQKSEVKLLESKMSDFNKSVKMLSDLEKSLKSKIHPLDELDSLAKKNDITINRIYLQQGGFPAVFSGETDSQDKILAFKNNLAQKDIFSSVSLNLSDIKPQAKGFSFTINFNIK